MTEIGSVQKNDNEKNFFWLKLCQYTLFLLSFFVIEREGLSFWYIMYRRATPLWPKQVCCFAHWLLTTFIEVGVHRRIQIRSDVVFFLPPELAIDSRLTGLQKHHAAPESNRSIEVDLFRFLSAKLAPFQIGCLWRLSF